MQDQLKQTQKVMLNTLSDIEHARRLLKAGLHRQAAIKMAAIEASLHTTLAVEEIEPHLPASYQSVVNFEQTQRRARSA